MAERFNLRAEGKTFGLDFVVIDLVEVSALPVRTVSLVGVVAMRTLIVGVADVAFQNGPFLSSRSIEQITTGRTEDQRADRSHFLYEVGYGWKYFASVVEHSAPLLLPKMGHTDARDSGTGDMLRNVRCTFESGLRGDTGLIDALAHFKLPS